MPDSARTEDAPPSEELIQSLLACPADFDSNFSSEYEVTLNEECESVFAKLGQGSTLEESVRLSDLCRGFQLLSEDSVDFSSEQSLHATACRCLEAVPDTSVQPASDHRRLERRFFWLQEAVPILPFGLYDHMVTIGGCLTSDKANNLALYESSADGGILIWKLRTFTPSEDGRSTRIKEVIKGKSGKWIRGLVEKETRRAHK